MGKGVGEIYGPSQGFQMGTEGDQSSLTEYKGYYGKLTANKGDKITSPPPLPSGRFLSSL